MIRVTPPAWKLVAGVLIRMNRDSSRLAQERGGLISANFVWGLLCQALGHCRFSGLDVRAECLGWMRDDLRGARARAPSSRRNLVFGRSARDLDHDARMRIGSEAPWRRTHSHPRLKGHCLGRDTATLDRPRQPAPTGERAPKRKLLVDARRSSGHGRKAMPCAASPVVTKRHSAISSFLARAMIMVLRVRARYHCASALSFWNRRKRHAS